MSWPYRRTPGLTRRLALARIIRYAASHRFRAVVLVSLSLVDRGVELVRAQDCPPIASANALRSVDPRVERVGQVRVTARRKLLRDQVSAVVQRIDGGPVPWSAASVALAIVCVDVVVHRRDRVDAGGAQRVAGRVNRLDGQRRLALRTHAVLELSADSTIDADTDARYTGASARSICAVPCGDAACSRR